MFLLPLFSVSFLKAGGNRSRKSPPDSLFLGRTLGGCSLFGHSCLGGHGKRSSSSSPVTASVESRQQQVGGNMMNWPGEELSPLAAVAELRNSKNRQQILVNFFLYINLSLIDFIKFNFNVKGIFGEWSSTSISRAVVTILIRRLQRELNHLCGIIIIINTWEDITQ